MHGFYGKNVYHRISIYENCMISILSRNKILDATQKVFLVILKICPKNFFVFFSTANRVFYANKRFPKKNFLHAKFNFCVHNVVLDTIILAFFFSLHIVFSKTLKVPISFVWRVYVCLDQSLIICQKLKVC